jgi:hypothetical protein
VGLFTGRAKQACGQAHATCIPSFSSLSSSISFHSKKKKKRVQAPPDKLKDETAFLFFYYYIQQAAISRVAAIA